MVFVIWLVVGDGVIVVCVIVVVVVVVFKKRECIVKMVKL